MYIKHRHEWQLQEAKARFSQVVRAAVNDPQIITVRNEPTAVVISFAEYQKTHPEITKKESAISLYHLLQNSPLAGLELELIRDRSLPREENLFE